MSTLVFMLLFTIDRISSTSGGNIVPSGFLLSGEVAAELPLFTVFPDQAPVAEAAPVAIRRIQLILS